MIPKIETVTRNSNPQTPRVLVQRTQEDTERVISVLKELSRSGHSARGTFLRHIDNHLARLGKAFYPYQIEALRRFATIRPKQILQAPIAGPFGGLRSRPKRIARSSLLISPTGSGKTSIFSPEILNDVREGKRVLVLTHRNFLSHQILKRIKDSCPDNLKDELLNDKIQIIRGKKTSKKKQSANTLIKEVGLKDADKNKPITIASVQTLNMNIDKLPKFFKDFDTIVIDEAHHYTADNYLQTLDAVVAKIPKETDLKIIGATATPLRHTSGVVPISDIFPLENIVWTRSMLQLIIDGKLKEPHGIRINTNLGEDLKINRETQNVNKEDIRRLTEKPEFNKLFFDTYEKNCKGKNAIFFANDRGSAKAMLKEAIDRKIPVAMILGNRTVLVDPKTWKKTIITDKQEALDARETVFKEFGKSIKMIINCKVLTEAVDLVKTQVIGHGSLTRSTPELQQIIGRGMRLDPDHPEETQFDFIYIDPETKEKFGFANLATLGLEQFEPLNQGGIEGAGTGPLTIDPLQENLALDGTVIEGGFVDKPDPEWKKILDEALLKAIKSDLHFMGLSTVKNLELKLQNARIRLTELLGLTTNSKLNLTDLVVGSDILFGAHGCTKIREAQRIFRDMVKLLPGLDLQEIQIRFPRLTGFETFEDLKKFMRSLYPQRPEKSSKFLEMTNARFGIDEKYIESLSRAEGLGNTPSLAEIFDDIWSDSPSWNAVCNEVCEHLTEHPKDKEMTSRKLLNALNRFLKTIGSKAEAKAIDLESIRNLQVFTYRNKLTAQKAYAEFIDAFIPNLERIVWLEKNQADLDKDKLSPEQIAKLTGEPISMQKALIKSIERSKDIMYEILDKASGLRKYGRLDSHGSIVEHLKKLLATPLKNELKDFSLPASLQTSGAITALLQKIGTNCPKLKGILPRIESTLLEHLGCMNSVMQYLKKLESTSDVNPKLIAKMKKDLFS